MVVKHNSIWVLLNIVAHGDLELEQLNVKFAFVHRELDEEFYMHQPEGFKVGDKESKVCRLRKSLYGLKQSPRQWYKRFNSFMLKYGNEIFSPLVKHTSIWVLLSIVAHGELEQEQLDVKTAFLHGELDEEIYMH